MSCFLGDGVASRRKGGGGQILSGWVGTSVCWSGGWLLRGAGSKFPCEGSEYT